MRLHSSKSTSDLIHHKKIFFVVAFFIAQALGRIFVHRSSAESLKMFFPKYRLLPYLLFVASAFVQN
ncbi:hypothetical protein HMPREF1987_01725 [Peptostreptococcaceae bacterium oral taxon 113 str. W5053]|nr:hypothetical protein HMPREF1987_01725 [Peptostreptococcaceae bacterium oral taxon 113 str. W5053]